MIRKEFRLAVWECGSQGFRQAFEEDNRFQLEVVVEADLFLLPFLDSPEECPMKCLPVL